MRHEYLHVRRFVKRGYCVVPEITWIEAPVVDFPMQCFLCNQRVTDKDLIDLSQIRFHRTYCRPHFRQALGARKTQP